MRAPSEENSDDSKDSFYGDLEQVFNQFPMYHMKILLGDFNAQLGWEDIFKLMTRNESLHDDSNDNGDIIVNFATQKGLFVKSTMSPHQNVHKYAWNYPEGKTHNQSNKNQLDATLCSFYFCRVTLQK